MGYTTDFSGQFTLDKPLTEAQASYLNKLATSRRMFRNPDMVAKLPDPTREAVGLPVGVDGEFYVGSADDGEHGQAGMGWGSNAMDKSIVDHNVEPRTQPGLWCQWQVTEDRQHIEWDENEKFYEYIPWLAYICRNFLTPWGYKLSGKVEWSGESGGDYGTIDGAEVQANPNKYQPRHKWNGDAWYDEQLRKHKAQHPQTDAVPTISNGTKALN